MKAVTLILAVRKMLNGRKWSDYTNHQRTEVATQTTSGNLVGRAEKSHSRDGFRGAAATGTTNWSEDSSAPLTDAGTGH